MPDQFSELLEATVGYLEDLKSAGQKWIVLAPGILTNLSSAANPGPQTRHQPQPTPPAAFLAGAAVPAESVVTTPVVSLATSVAAPATTKVEAMGSLRCRVIVCEQCPHLVRSRKSVVFGVGDIESPLMFVGEAPGADEDRQGEPFVGAAGQLLTRIIKAMGFTRENVYIANVLKCRPDTPGQASGNRKPTADEMRTCLPYLLEQIRIIQPKVIVALGATAMEGLFGKAIGITKARGHWMTFDSIPVMPTYHPSYLLRNQSLVVKRQVWEDMLQVLERLGATITEKQRNYFKE